MICVGIVASTAAMRAGLQSLLSGDTAIEVVGQAMSLSDLMRRTTNLDVIVMLVERDGFLQSLPEAFIEELIDLPASIGLLWIGDEVSGFEHNQELLLRPWGVLPADTSHEELIAAVHALGEGLAVGAPGLIHDLFNHSTRLNGTGEVTEINDLTQREVEVLQHLAQGLANKQIAEQLKISPHTVKFHIASIYSKIGATNRAEAVRLGIQHGLLTI